VRQAGVVGRRIGGHPMSLKYCLSERPHREAGYHKCCSRVPPAKPLATVGVFCLRPATGGDHGNRAFRFATDKAPRGDRQGFFLPGGVVGRGIRDISASCAIESLSDRLHAKSGGVCLGFDNRMRHDVHYGWKQEHMVNA